MTTRIKYAFGVSGEQTSVPDTSTGTELSFDQGWSSAYELEPADAGYREIDRKQHNYLWNALSGNIKQYQESLYPAHFDDIDYPVGMVTTYAGVNYQRTSGSGVVADPSTSNDFSVFNGIMYAPNKIKTSQLVVVGADGNAVPSVVPTSYAIGEEVALGWKALTAVTNLITDANGNVKLTDVGVDTGTIYYDIDLADNNTPVLATLFGSVMRCTDAATGEYVQIFENNSTALTISNPTATTARLTIDLVDLEDGFKVAGLSDFRGRLEVLSDSNVEFEARGYLEIKGSGLSAGYTAHIYRCGKVHQFGYTPVTGSTGIVTVTLPVELKNTTIGDGYLTVDSMDVTASPINNTLVARLGFVLGTRTVTSFQIVAIDGTNALRNGNAQWFSMWGKIA